MGPATPERFGVTRTIVLLAALLLPAPLMGQTVLVVITGIGGEDRYDERFHTWAATLMDAATDRYGLPDSNVVYLAADPERDPARATARSTKENIQTTLSRLAGTTPEGDLVFMVVIGHGSYRNGISKINLPGPDMTATEFAVALDAFGDRPIVFANLSSASGEFVKTLSAPNRTIITATKSGMERNQSVFGQFLAVRLGEDLHEAAVLAVEPSGLLFHFLLEDRFVRATPHLLFVDHVARAGDEKPIVGKNHGLGHHVGLLVNPVVAQGA
jgi:hypothetical protein